MGDGVISVEELAHDLGCDEAVVLRLCRDRGIRASGPTSLLDPVAQAAVRDALSGVPGAAPGAVGAGVSARLVAVSAEGEATSSAPVPSFAAPAGPGAPPPQFGEAAFPVQATGVPLAKPMPPRTSNERMRAAELTSGLHGLVVALVATALWAGVHLLPDWDEGRWWLLSVLLAPVAVLASLWAVIRGVGGAFSAARHPTTQRGVFGSIVLTVVAGALLVSTTLLAVYDWTAIDVPAAWDRLQLGKQEELDTVDERLDRIQGSSGGVETPYARLQPGDCVRGDRENGGVVRVVDCDLQHQAEVVGRNPHDALGDTYPGAEALELRAVGGCTGPFAAYVGIPPSESRYLLDVISPTEQQWVAGARTSVCLAATSGGLVVGTVRGSGD